jgi:hypothetical protein
VAIRDGRAIRESDDLLVGKELIPDGHVINETIDIFGEPGGTPDSRRTLMVFSMTSRFGMRFPRMKRSSVSPTEIPSFLARVAEVTLR